MGNEFLWVPSLDSVVSELIQTRAVPKYVMPDLVCTGVPAASRWTLRADQDRWLGNRRVHAFHARQRHKAYNKILLLR